MSNALVFYVSSVGISSFAILIVGFIFIFCWDCFYVFARNFPSMHFISAALSGHMCGLQPRKVDEKRKKDRMVFVCVCVICIEMSYNCDHCVVLVPRNLAQSIYSRWPVGFSDLDRNTSVQKIERHQTEREMKYAVFQFPLDLFELLATFELYWFEFLRPNIDFSNKTRQ